jgi:hypothetical protein
MHDSLAYSFAEAMGHQAVAALATIHTTTVTSKLTVPVQQRGSSTPKSTASLLA